MYFTLKKLSLETNKLYIISVIDNSDCDDDPLLYFPFATHDNDIQCHKAEGISHGAVTLTNGAACLDGTSAYIEVRFYKYLCYSLI